MRSSFLVGIALFLGTVALPRVAAANDEIDEANRLLSELLVEEAKEKFEEVLESGEATPEDTAAIHLGLGQVAASLGDEKEAKESYKRALAIDPLLDLPAGSSPKVAQPLQDARALFRKGAKQLALAVNIDTATGVQASARVLSDPFKMVSGIRVDHFLEDGEELTKTIKSGDLIIQIPLAPDGTAIVVSLIDKHGNRLVTNEKVELPSGERPNRLGEEDTSSGGGETGGGVSTGGGGGGEDSGGGSFITNWKLWAGLAVGAGAVGGGFGFWMRTTVSDINDKTENSGEHEFSDVAAQVDQAEQRALIANISFGVAGACAAAAVIFYILGDDDSTERQTAVVPVIGPQEVGVSASIRF